MPDNDFATAEQRRISTALAAIDPTLADESEYWAQDGELWSIYLTAPQATDDIVGTLVAELALAPRLRIFLEGSKVGPNGIQLLQRLPRLQWLSVGGSVTDDCLPHISRLHGLMRLDFYKSRITDTGLAPIRDLQRLVTLVIECKALTDAAIDHVQSLTKLEYLRLLSPKITDIGLVRLGNLPRLKELAICGKHITDAGVAQIRRSIPGLYVTKYP